MSTPNELNDNRRGEILRITKRKVSEVRDKIANDEREERRKTYESLARTPSVEVRRIGEKAKAIDKKLGTICKEKHKTLEALEKKQAKEFLEAADSFDKKIRTEQKNIENLEKAA